MTNRDKGILFSIIIVNYNSGLLLKDCLISIIDNLENGYEIIVYDNASSDDSLRLVKSTFGADSRIKILEGEENLGFAKANNRAAFDAKGKYLHFLNPDIIVNPLLRTDYNLIAGEQGESVYVNTLTDEKGHILKNRYLVPRLNNYFFRLFRKERTAYWSIGASLIMHHQTFEKVKGWPEDYFMYAEDLDLFYTLYKNHIRIRYLDTRLMHIGKGTTRKLWTESKRALRVELSFKKFYRKHGFPVEYFIVRPILLIYIMFHQPAEFFLQIKTFIRATFIRTR